jgi:integrase
MPLHLTRRPRSPFWIMRGNIRGVRYEESTGTSDRGAAEEIRIRREAEILEHAVQGRPAETSFADAVVSYLETGGRHGNGGSKRFMKAVLDHLGNMPLVDIGLDEIERGARIVYPRASAATRNRQFITPAVAVLRHAARRRWCSSPVIARPLAPPGVVRWLKLDEADRLIEAASPHLQPLLVFLFYTGARVGEALWLDWHNLDLARGHVSFVKTKNTGARGVPLHPRVVAVLASLKHRAGPVFLKPKGQPYERPRRSDDTSAGTRISKGFKAACRRAGIEKFRVHDCRHTWATWHYAANRDLVALKALGGWKSEQMVLRYAHINVEQLADTIAALPGGQMGDSVGNSNIEKGVKP